MDSKEIALREKLFSQLSRHRVMTLAYLDQGLPAACAVWFSVTENLTCYFLSTPRTHHGAALMQAGEVAFTVQKDEQDWRTVQGVQGKGYCQPVTPEYRENAWQAYSSRFPFVIQPFGSIAAALAAVTIWVVTPHWLRLIDNTKGLGHKEELILRENEQQYRVTKRSKNRKDEIEDL